MSLADILADQNPWWADPHARLGSQWPVRRDLQPRVLRQVARIGDRRAALLVGPRQVGKSVLLKQVADDLLEEGWPASNLLYFDLDDERITEQVSPREILQIPTPDPVSHHPRILLLDEIGRAPGWDRWLKRAVDEGHDRIAAADSAASILRAASRESGPGRWDLHAMEGLSFREYLRLQGGEGVEDTLKRLPNPVGRYLAGGGYPEHALNEDFAEVRRRLRSDVADRAIRHDLARLGVDVERIRDLFVYLVQDSGAILDAKARADSLEADPRSVREWVRLLQDTMLIVSLPRHVRGASARLRSRPRLYAADHGLVTSFAPLPNPMGDPDVRGRVVEAAVFRHLREAAESLGGRLSYFRKADDLEADFVLETAGGLAAVEATSSANPGGRKIDRLRRASDALGASTALLVHGGYAEDRRGPVRLVPLLRFLLDPVAFFEEESR